MEKSLGYDAGHDSPRRTSTRPYLKAAAILAILGTTVLLNPARSTWRLHGQTSHAATDPQDKPFDWDKLESKPHLQYSSCYGEFECARLELPMDYWNGSTDATISLAVIRKPAEVPVTDPRYGGAVLLNPGGPGGSGVSLLSSGGEHIRKTIDGDKYFDLMSFDPRGTLHHRAEW